MYLSVDSPKLHKNRVFLIDQSRVFERNFPLKLSSTQKTKETNQIYFPRQSATNRRTVDLSLRGIYSGMNNLLGQNTIIVSRYFHLHNSHHLPKNPHSDNKVDCWENYLENLRVFQYHFVHGKILLIHVYYVHQKSDHNQLISLILNPHSQQTLLVLGWDQKTNWDQLGILPQRACFLNSPIDNLIYWIIAAIQEDPTPKKYYCQN